MSGASEPYAPTESQAVEILAPLVALAPTNLEDPAHHRYEKPNYPRAAERIARLARSFGLATRIFDPTVDGPPSPPLGNTPRPNVVIDLDRGTPVELLILAHYDVVPVPDEQRARWRSPPHSLTKRSDGRFYGRGANDDLGSGVTASLLALRRLVEDDDAPRSIRLLVCCDEETGGAGGVEAMKSHDEALAPGDPGRFLVGEVALLPDGSPHASAGSSGLILLDAGFAHPTPLPSILDYADALIALDLPAKRWRSPLASPDWPDHGAPEPVITGRATLTKFDLSAPPDGASRLRLVGARAETDATNQIASAVTLVFAGSPDQRADVPERCRAVLPAPFRVETSIVSSLTPPAGTTAIQVVGLSSHGGYPHRGHNPVPAALGLIRTAVSEGWMEPAAAAEATFGVDLRLTPEMTLEPTSSTVVGGLESWLREHRIDGTVSAPPERCRGGYALAPDHPTVLHLERLLREETGEGGVYGEYGGTDASSLAHLRTRSGAPLPALVFGSMDRAAHIHEAEESVDPRLLLAVSRVLYRFARGT